jgi:hypothetical protein
MLERIMVGIGAVFCFVVLGWSLVLSNRYKRQGEVVQATRGGIVFEDVSGNLWAIDYEKGYKVGDEVVITFDANGTWDTITDDIILTVEKKSA